MVVSRTPIAAREAGCYPPLHGGGHWFKSSSAHDKTALASAGLDIERSAPITLHDIDFDNTPSTATFNVRSTSSPPNIITFENYGGTFAGPAFEDDLNGAIEWTSPGLIVRLIPLRISLSSTEA